MRKEKTITLDDRGKKLTFRIKEMSATGLESWIIRAMLLVGGNKGKGGESVKNAADFINADGLRLLSSLDYGKAKPLLDELLACCTRIDGGIEQLCTPDSVDGYIEDVKTLFTLRMEALKLNLDFLAQESLSGSQKGELTSGIKI